jgi:hypothetical protein
MRVSLDSTPSAWTESRLASTFQPYELLVRSSYYRELSDARVRTLNLHGFRDPIASMPWLLVCGQRFSVRDRGRVTDVLSQKHNLLLINRLHRMRFG